MGKRQRPDVFEPSPKPVQPNFFSPDIQAGDLDGASEEEFTGMRAEFTSKSWFDSPRGLEHRRLYAWYGYFGGNMSWRGFMTLVRKVHFRGEPDMKLPKKEQRADRKNGVKLTNLEKCLVAKMFLTTGACVQDGGRGEEGWHRVVSEWHTHTEWEVE